LLDEENPYENKDEVTSLEIDMQMAYNDMESHFRIGIFWDEHREGTYHIR